MNQAPQITFHNIEHSNAVETAILSRLEKIDASYRGLGQWHVVLDIPHRHHRKGNPYHVRIETHLHGKPVLVEYPHDERTATEDVYEALKHTFDHLERQLRDLVDTRVARRHTVA